MQQIALKPICLLFFKKFYFCLFWKLGIGIFFLSFFLAHSLFESCNFHKCCKVAQPKAVGFGDFFSLYLNFFISVAQYVLLATKLNVKFLMATACYRFIHLFFLMESVKWKNFELLII